MINVKFAFRLLAKTPFVTAIAIASLALGIGANAAIFSLVNQLLLQPLPVPQPGTLVNLSAPGPKPGSQSCSGAGDCTEVFSYPMYQDLAREQSVFTGMAAHRGFGANLSARQKTLSGEGMLVSGNYFSVLQLTPALGRLLSPDDDRQPGTSPVAVLTYAFWQSHFGGDPGVLNQIIIVNGQSLTIVGVAPRGFSGTTLGSQPRLFVPITMRNLMEPGFNGFTNRQSYWVYAFARLKPGVSIVQARAALNVPYRTIVTTVEAPLQRGMSDATMARFKSKEVGVVPGMQGQSQVGKEARAPLFLLLGVTVFVLLIACGNIANLLLARGAARAGEMAVRLSIGGSRAQLVAQLLTESALLGLAGGLLSLVVARITLSAMASILPEEVATTFHVFLDLRVVAFTMALTLGTVLLFGLFPALFATRPDLTSAIRAQAGQPSGGRSASRWRTVLATTQIALSMALLASAGLFTKSLANVSRVDLGVQIEHVATFGVSPELNAYKPAQSARLMQQLEEELGRTPGVNGVTVALVPLLAGSNWGTNVNVEGFTAGPDIDNNSRYNEVGAGYFSTLGVPLVAGREFTGSDVLGAPKVAIVNQTFAKKFNLGANPVGRHMDIGNRKFDIEIVGLAQDAKYSDVKDEIPPLFFLPYAQDSTVGSASFYVRTSLEPEQILPALPKALAKLDPNLPIENLRTMPDQVRRNTFDDRFISIFAGVFAALATLLAGIGLYGVLAYTVAQRTREIGVRMALGAAPSRVRMMVLKQVARMTLIGGVIGLAAAIGVGRVTQSMLYRMQGYDPLVLAASAVILSAVALSAGGLPARRASQVDPIRALRYE